MATRRQQRLNELLQEELSMLVPGRVDDPRIADATITRVETTQDMGTAKVYFATSTDSNDDAIAEMLSGLQHASHFLRQELGGLGLRRIPRLVFSHDRAFEGGQRVLDILGKLGNETSIPAAGEVEGDDAASSTDSDSTDGDPETAPSPSGSESGT